MRARTARTARRRLAPGDVLMEGLALRSVERDVERGRARLKCEGATIAFEGVRATTLLGPWDGAAGVVEFVKVVAVDAGETCLEVRVRYATVPRVYRVVCRSVRSR